MPTTPAGAISLPEKYLADSLAACATFQTLVGAADATEALTRIHFEGLPPPANGDTYTAAEFEEYFPYALIYTPPEGGFSKHADARGDDGALEFLGAGQIHIEIMRQIPAAIADDRAEVDRTFKNIVGTIVDELCDLSGQDTYFEFMHIAGVGPYRFHPDRAPTEGDGQGYELAVSYDERGQGQN
jgi:hypothetical protein